MEGRWRRSRADRLTASRDEEDTRRGLQIVVKVEPVAVQIRDGELAQPPGLVRDRIDDLRT